MLTQCVLIHLQVTSVHVKMVSLGMEKLALRHVLIHEPSVPDGLNPVTVRTTRQLLPMNGWTVTAGWVATSADAMITLSLGKRRTTVPAGRNLGSAPSKGSETTWNAPAQRPVGSARIWTPKITFAVMPVTWIALRWHSTAIAKIRVTGASCTVTARKLVNFAKTKLPYELRNCFERFHFIISIYYSVNVYLTFSRRKV